jgi:hypothetical protein
VPLSLFLYYCYFHFLFCFSFFLSVSKVCFIVTAMPYIFVIFRAFMELRFLFFIKSFIDITNLHQWRIQH